jgi:TPP-dependent pyruvate/acetoin dehydrogenase alpha subunit
VSRSAHLGVIPGLAGKLSAATSLEMFSKICFNRFFELEVARVYDTGVIKAPVYLSVGQEHIPAAIATASTDFLIFAQHRAHAYYLSFGGDPGALVDELLHRPSGCAGGMGGSASIHDPRIGMFGHSGLMGDQVPIAVGAALGSGRRVLTVMGDASAEEDYVSSAMGYAATKRLPVLFVCEDNDRSILTPVATRRSWRLADVAHALGLAAVDITDDPWLVANHVADLLFQLRALVNVRRCRQLWHAGTGNDGEPEWNRFALIKETLTELGLEREAAAIEEEALQRAVRAWDERSPRP